MGARGLVLAARARPTRAHHLMTRYVFHALGGRDSAKGIPV